MPTFALADLEQRIWGGLDNNQDEFSEPNLRSVINEGAARLNLLIGLQSATVAITGGTVAGQLEYTTPAGIAIPLRLDYNGRPLSSLSLTRLAIKYRDWATDTTAIGPVARWARIGVTRFVIHPTDLTGGNVLEMTGVAPFTPLVQQNDPLTMDDQFADILVDYAKHRLPLKEGGKPFASSSVAYQIMVRKLKTLTRWQAMKWPAYWLIEEQEPSEGRGAGVK